MILRAIVVLSLFDVLAGYSDVKADVYRYTAPNGQVYYTDQPRHKKYRLVSRTKRKFHRVDYKHLKENKRRYAPIIREAAAKHGVDSKLVHAVIYAESAYDTQAISSAGAVGLMQLMPATARQYGADNREDPAQNIFAGTRYLKHLLGLFDNNLALSVAAYNAGENAVKKYKNQIPPYPETQKYVKKVLKFYRNNLS